MESLELEIQADIAHSVKLSGTALVNTKRLEVKTLALLETLALEISMKQYAWHLSPCILVHLRYV